MAEIKAGMTVVAKRDEPEITKGKHYEVFNEKFGDYVLGDSGTILYVKPSEDNLVPVDEVVDESLAPNMVDSPPHYQNARFETIEVIEEITAGYSDGFVAYALGNSLKYIARAPYKHGDNGLEDLRKSARYLQYAIERIEKTNSAE